jgi:hypothetical protein
VAVADIVQSFRPKFEKWPGPLERLDSDKLLSRFASANALSHTLAQSPLRQFGGGLSVLILAAASGVLPLALASGVR